MFKFETLAYLYALILILILAILFGILLNIRKKTLNRFVNKKLYWQVIPSISYSRIVLKFIVLSLALLFIIIAIARPQFGTKLQKLKREGIEIIIALDVSRSMLAEDIQPNRLEKSKRAVYQLISKLRNDKIGLIIFAGNAYTQMPISSDYASAKMFLNTINTHTISSQGTAIGDAIHLAAQSFDMQSKAAKVIMIVTDGENHEGEAETAATTVAQKGIKIYTIGIGLPEGAPIPIYLNGKKNFLKDKEGTVVISKLNPQMLQKIAMIGDGMYINDNNASSNILDNVLKDIDKLQKEELETKLYSEYAEQFQYFITAALFLLLLELLILEKKNKFLEKMKLFA